VDPRENGCCLQEGARDAWHKRGIVRKECTRDKIQQANQRVRLLRKDLWTTMISEEMRPERTTTGRHGNCYQELQNQRLDIVEGSMPSKKGKLNCR
jgi:hypothetical protein